MLSYLRAACLAVVLAQPLAAQQDVAWVQIEAQPSLGAAQDRVRVYDRQFADLAGFAQPGGWYGIVLGPYSRADAETLLGRLRSSGAIPGDSFVSDGGNFRQQFWPIGVAAAATAQPLPGADPLPDTPEPEEVAIEDAPAPIPAEETPAQARASEAVLDREAKRELQRALAWAGFYDAAIDGSYGRGTRAAMSAWQEARNREVTGILTSAQRADLLGEYNAVLDGMDLQVVQDDATGIEIAIPTGVVAFAEYEPPFARFDPKSDDLPAQVLLISQAGDRARFGGLYEILQTLAVVPPEGERSRGDNGFTIDATGDDIRSFTRATLRDGEIKGFMLVWPAGDERRFARVRDAMEASFTAIDGVLDPAIAPVDEDQAIDLIAGLEVRKPRLSRSGFFIDASGLVLTTTEVLEGCDRLTIGAEIDASIAHRDDRRGLAVLRPDQALAPLGVAAFQTAVPRIQAQVAVAGFPYGGVLVTPALTFGTLADLRGLDGEESVKRLTLTAQEGDAGGPVYDNGGAVLGMFLPRDRETARQLPAEVGFALDTEEIIASLTDAGIAVETTDRVAFMAPETLTQRAADETVLVSCW